VILNTNETFLNGEFSIDEYVNLSLEVIASIFSNGQALSGFKAFTITNVTLKDGSGYKVEFVNPANHSDVYATSNTFEVKPAGSE
jgi:hypothetical protein